MRKKSGRRTLIVVVFFRWRHLGGSLGTPHQKRLPFDGVAKVHGQALVLLLIVMNQIVQSLEEDLL